MKDKPTQAAHEETFTPSDTSLCNQEREALKHLLLHEERERIVTLERLLDDPTEHALLMGRDLSRAIRESSAKGKLSNALAPTVGEILHDSVRKDPQTMADALYPAMGPSIRRSISEALRSMVQSFNEALSHSFSWQGLKWRLEALRTKKPFAEVVLLNSLVYRVEQIFLIHRETGLVLQHLSAPSVVHQDADMVSGMLTAIQDFVRDSFATGEGTLDALRVGELRVLIEQESTAVLALIVRGSPPVSLSGSIRAVLQSVQEEMYPQLKDYQGDSAPFESIRPLLMDCFEANYQQKKKSQPYAAMLVASLVLLLLAGGFGYRYVEWKKDQALWNGFISILDDAPGIVVTAHGETDDGKKFVRGLRDPLAESVDEIVGSSGLPSGTVNLDFTLYRSMEPAFVLESTKRVLMPPESVTLSFEHGTLLATGQADHAWILRVRELLSALPDIQIYDGSGLEDIQQTVFNDLQSGVEQTTIQFSTRSDAVVPGQEETIVALTQKVLQMQNVSNELNNNFILAIQGYTDATGSEWYNKVLSGKRAKLVHAMLVDSGIDAGRLTIEAMGSSKIISAGNVEADHMKNRRVEFIVRTTSQTTTTANE